MFSLRNMYPERNHRRLGRLVQCCNLCRSFLRSPHPFHLGPACRSNRCPSNIVPPSNMFRPRNRSPRCTFCHLGRDRTGCRRSRCRIRPDWSGRQSNSVPCCKFPTHIHRSYHTLGRSLVNGRCKVIVYILPIRTRFCVYNLPQLCRQRVLERIRCPHRTPRPKRMRWPCHPQSTHHRGKTWRRSGLLSSSRRRPYTQRHRYRCRMAGRRSCSARRHIFRQDNVVAVRSHRCIRVCRSFW